MGDEGKRSRSGCRARMRTGSRCVRPLLCTGRPGVVGGEVGLPQRTRRLDAFGGGPIAWDFPVRARSRTVDLTAAQRDRAVGAVIGMATGDALGAATNFSHRTHPIGSR